MTIWISGELLLFNLERLDVLCVWIGHPIENLWAFEFLETFVVQFRASWHIMCLNQTLESKVVAFWIILALWCSILSISIYYLPELDIQFESYDLLNLPCALMFNFKHLDILCTWIGHPSEKLWPYEFLESFRCSILCVSIYYWPESDIRVKTYRRLNSPCALIFNFGHLDILCAWIGHPIEKLWQFEIFKSFCSSIANVSIH